MGGAGRSSMIATIRRGIAEGGPCYTLRSLYGISFSPSGPQSLGKPGGSGRRPGSHASRRRPALVRRPVRYRGGPDSTTSPSGTTSAVSSGDDLTPVPLDRSSRSAWGSGRVREHSHGRPRPSDDRRNRLIWILHNFAAIVANSFEADRSDRREVGLETEATIAGTR